MSDDLKPGEWLRSDNLIYALVSAGFWKGKERFCNLFEISVGSANRKLTAEELDALQARVHRLPRLEQSHAALLEACKEAIVAMDEAYQATGYVRVAKGSKQRNQLEAAIALAEGAAP